MSSKVVQAKHIVACLKQDSDADICILRGKHISGKLSLKHCTVNIPIVFHNCTFLDEVDFRNCEFTQAVDLSDSTFCGGFNSGDDSGGPAIYRKDFFCTNATFEGPVTCTGGRFEGSAFFNESEFRSTKDTADFSHTYFERVLKCSGARFSGPVTFNSIRCEDTGFFDNGFTSKKWITFSYASFGSNLECNEATFEDGASYTSVECGDNGFFNGTRFTSDELVSLRYLSTGTSLELNGTYFAGKADLGAIQIGQKLHLAGTRGVATFQKEVNLYNASINVLVLGNDESADFPFKGNLDLRGCTIEHFDATKTRATKFVEMQDKQIFSRDPYLQLEDYHQRIGDDAEAKKIYFTGRSKLRENAFDPNGITRWSVGRKVSDVLLWVLSGYGVRSWLLLVYALLVVLIGTGVFWANDALEVKPSSTTATSTVEVVSTDFKQKLFDRPAYSLDLFLPIDLNKDGTWQPDGLPREIYAMVHTILGWLLIPLLVASLAGFLRREGSQT